MFKERYINYVKQIKPGNELMNSVMQTAHVHERSDKRLANRMKLPAAAAAAAVLCFFLVMPVLAAKVDAVYALMYKISPGTAQFFMPVQKKDVDNGIEMEVISAYVQEGKAQVYIAMRDLTGDRIDETIDLYDSYSINRPFDSSAYCEATGYDEATRTASFLITIDAFGNRKIEGDKITFSVREFLSHKEDRQNVGLPIALSESAAAEEQQTVSPLGFGGTYDLDGGAAALVAENCLPGLGIEGIDITGFGYIEGKLHIQTAVKNAADNGNHGWLYLRDGAGNKVECVYNFSFMEQKEGDVRIDYNEFVFDIPQEEIADYSAYGDFTTAKMKTEGKWKVTFPVEKYE